jgi:hypothetical protein
MSAENILEDYLPQPKLAEQLGKSTRTLGRWATLRIGPPVTYIGREPHYRIDAVREWLAGREQKMVRERGRKVA